MADTDFVPTEACVQAVVWGRHNSGKLMYNTLSFLAPHELPTAADVQTVATMVAAWVHDAYIAVFSDKITVINVHARSMAEEPAPEYDAVPAGGTGQQDGDLLPLSQAALVQLHTGLTGQSQAGRVYVFTATEDNQTNGLFTTTYALACDNAFVALRTAANTSGYPWAVWSRVHRRLTPVGGVITNIVPYNLRSRRINKGI
jgi:hypothetical protein